MSENNSEKQKHHSTKDSVTFFATQEDFRRWLEKNHEKEPEIIVGYYKVGSGKPSLTWPQSVDQALCFGWIDGVRKSINEESYCIRFTPRRSDSTWSAVNIRKVEELTNAGLMKPAGLLAFSHRKTNKSGIYSYENEPFILDPDMEKLFRKNKKAWDFFSKQAPSYQKAILRWIMSAVQEKTRQSRLEKTIQASGDHKRVLQ